MRIEVGYGLEGSLTDAKSNLITSTIMKPRLQSGDYNGAVEHGVEAILNTIGSESYKGNGHSVAEANAGADWASHRAMIPAFFFFAIVLFLVIGRLRARPRRAYASSGFSGDDSSSSSSDFSSSDSSSSSDFDSGGGDGGGGGASDSW
ncbi:MAG TPA: TPM domain-containing protein, partial [Thermoanaerobaculia bacterium]|nr:TPM domain-containing protein [Thermoanaerobaculia bacterium]